MWLSTTLLLLMLKDVVDSFGTTASGVLKSFTASGDGPVSVRTVTDAAHGPPLSVAVRFTGAEFGFSVRITNVLPSSEAAAIQSAQVPAGPPSHLVFSIPRSGLDCTQACLADSLVW